MRENNGILSFFTEKTLQKIYLHNKAFYISYIPPLGGGPHKVA
jgi:hypothetical protein